MSEFDTLSAKERLEAAGADEQLARSIVETVSAAREAAVTKSDLVVVRADLESRIDRLETSTAARFDAIDARFDGQDERFEAIDRRFERIEHRLGEHSAQLNDLRADIQLLRAEFRLFRRDMLITAGTVGVAIIGVMSALKLFGS